MYKHKNASEYGVEGIYKNSEHFVKDNKNSTEKPIAIKKNSMIHFSFSFRTLSLRRKKNNKTVTINDKKVDPNSNSTQIINGVQLTPPNKEPDCAVIDEKVSANSNSVKSVATSADATSRPGILNPTEEEESYLDTINKIPGLRKILCLIYDNSDLYEQILSMNNFIKNSNIGDTGKLDYFKTIDKVSVSLYEICKNLVPEDNRIDLKNLALHYSSSLFEKKLWDKFTSSEGNYANIESDYATIEGEGGDDIRTENDYEIMERINQSVGEPIYMNISPTKSESERIDQAEKDDKPVEVKENDYEIMARINQSVGDDKVIEMEKNNPGVNTPYMLMGKDDKENIDPRQESDLADSTYMTMTGKDNKGAIEPVYINLPRPSADSTYMTMTGKDNKGAIEPVYINLPRPSADSTYMTMTGKNFFGTNSTAEKEVIRKSTNPLMLTV